MTQLANDRLSLPVTHSQPRKPRFNRSESLVGYLFILPSILGFLMFVVYPMVASAYLAFTEWDGVRAPEWVGLQNFQYMFTQDPVFWGSVRTTLVYVALLVPTSVTVGLLLALLLNRAMPGVRIFRTIFYLPAVLPIIATLTMWKFIFHPQFGLANAALRAVGLPPGTWLAGENSAMVTIIIITVWGVGSTMIIFLAALQTVPQELYEAAEIDGAGKVRMFFAVTIPMISPVIFLQVVMQMIAGVQEFARPAVLTGGGPNGATRLLMMEIYENGFGNLGRYAQLGYALAEVWVLFFIILCLTILTFRFSNMWVYNDNTLN
jgi:ABC-type sugar transport system permease subunit